MTPTALIAAKPRWLRAGRPALIRAIFCGGMRHLPFKTDKRGMKIQGVIDR